MTTIYLLITNSIGIFLLGYIIGVVILKIYDAINYTPTYTALLGSLLIVLLTILGWNLVSNLDSEKAILGILPIGLFSGFFYKKYNQELCNAFVYFLLITTWILQMVMMYKIDTKCPECF